MFPWLCFKCGHLADDKQKLVQHILDENHGLTPEEFEELTRATKEVKTELDRLA